MKNTSVLSLLIIPLLLLVVQPALAVVSVNSNQETTTSLAATGKKEQKQQKRLEKIMEKVGKKMDKLAKKGVDFTDDVDKWLWYAIVLGILSLVTSILFINPWLVVGFGWIPGILWTAAVVCFIVWILKYLEVI